MINNALSEEGRSDKPFTVAALNDEIKVIVGHIAYRTPLEAGTGPTLRVIVLPMAVSAGTSVPAHEANNAPLAFPRTL